MGSASADSANSRCRTCSYRGPVVYYAPYNSQSHILIKAVNKGWQINVMQTSITISRSWYFDLCTLTGKAMINLKIFLSLVLEAATVSQLALLFQMKSICQYSTFFRFIIATYCWFTSYVWGCQVISGKPQKPPMSLHVFYNPSSCSGFTSLSYSFIKLKICLNLQSIISLKHIVFKSSHFKNVVAV